MTMECLFIITVLKFSPKQNMRYRKWGNLAKSIVRILLGVPLSLEIRNTFPPGKGRAPVT